MKEIKKGQFFSEMNLFQGKEENDIRTERETMEAWEHYSEEEKIKLLRKEWNTLLQEKEEFQRERTYQERVLADRQKRVQEDELFFEQKMEILRSGFAQLEADKKAVEKEQLRLEAERKAMSGMSGMGMGVMDEEPIRLFFKGASNPLTLKKRYRDLIKIFHPDNLCGDTELLQRINRVYEMLSEEVGWQKKA